MRSSCALCSQNLKRVFPPKISDQARCRAGNARPSARTQTGSGTTNPRKTVSTRVSWINESPIFLERHSQAPGWPRRKPTDAARRVKTRPRPLTDARTCVHLLSCSTVAPSNRPAHLRPVRRRLKSADDGVLAPDALCLLKRAILRAPRAFRASALVFLSS